MRAFERLPAADGLILSRVTYEFVRPAPVGTELLVRADVVRSGRRVQLLEASLCAQDGIEVVRARALQVRAAAPEVPRTPPVPAPAGPEHGHESDLRPRFRPMFSTDSIEIRFITGGFHEGSAATAWLRLRLPLVAGEEPSPLQRLAAAGDFGNGISAFLPWDEFVFINPDLTLYIEREPVGQWIGLESQTLIAAGGIGTTESVLFDKHGRVGRATQALAIAAR